MSNTIDLSDSAAILVYGMEEQKKISALSERILCYLQVPEKDDLSMQLHAAVEYLQDISGIKSSHSFLKRRSKESLREKYRDAEKNVDKVTLILQQQQIQLMKDSAMFDQLYHMNEAYYNDLQDKITGAKEVLMRFGQTKLPTLKEQPEQLKKRISQLELSASIALQSAPLIKQLQANQISQAEKIQSILFHHIPLWKDQIFLAETNGQLIKSLDDMALARQQEILFKYQAQQELTKQLQSI